MERQGHGIIRLLLVALAAGVWVVVSLGGPLWITMAYLVVVAATITSPHCYSGKHVARAEFCGQVLPGELAGLLPHRAPAPRAFRNLAGTALALAILIGIPRIRLWRSTFFLSLFGPFLVVALAEILTFVCRGCQYSSGPVCNRRKVGAP